MTIAALIYGSGIDPALVLEKVVAKLRQRGVALAGVIQHSGEDCSMTLELLPSGLRIPMSQSLGAGSAACRLDSGALAQAASLVRKEIDTSPELVVFNKFGAQEAAGGGMRDEMLRAVMAGLSIIVPVRDSLLPQWKEFVGDEFVLLDCDPEAVLAWWDAQMQHSIT
ncbi:DUF2478 domain-containing protein [Noviherbaspirillum sp.]|uniref:DUF2478 domain-containing protein n=1 Tax=Noviherbaspirillum sp. TaxID=1926288 RepID=UPI002B49436D|nr:DUF2478 domain-containing protein [Noviherbaspirillum sp.]HJV80953.1 DUF2478 domain-containing protein [Noviherbaspirillum sp.]